MSEAPAPTTINYKLILAVTAIGSALILTHNTLNRMSLQSKKQQANGSLVIDSDKIIIALEPQNLFIDYSRERKEEFREIRKKRGSLMDTVFGGFARNSHFFREKASPKSIRKFVKDVRALTGIKLMIYTGIEPEYCQQMLQNLGISEYFNTTDRKYMKGKHKSAVEVNHETRRVIVISGKRQDKKDCIMSSNHNLILNLEEGRIEDELFVELYRFIRRLSSLGRIDHLHEEMYQIAMELGLPVFTDNDPSIIRK